MRSLLETYTLRLMVAATVLALPACGDSGGVTDVPAADAEQQALEARLRLGVAVSPANAELAPGSTEQFTVSSVSGSSLGNLWPIWRSSNSAVATVDSRGLVTAVGPGTAEISATVLLIYTGRATVTVVPSTNWTIAISPQRDTLYGPGASRQLGAMAVGTNGSQMTLTGTQWSSLNPAVATVDAAGRVTARALGTALIVAAAAGCSPDTATMVVAPGSPATVADLEVVGRTATSVTLGWTAGDDGAGGAANYVVRYGTPAIEWSAAAATQRSVTGTQVGSRVTYTYAGMSAGAGYQFQVAGYRGTLGQDALVGPPSNIASTLTEVAVASVTASLSSHTFTQLGAQQQVTATARDAGGNVLVGVPFVWSSSNASVVSVDAAGLMVAQAAGSALVIVTSSICCSGADTVQVQVQPAVAAPAGVSDLVVASRTQTTVTLRWTAVSDGVGGGANYAVRYGSPTIQWSSASGTEQTVAAAQPGTVMSYTYTGLSAGTAYQFQVVGYRVSPNPGTIYGPVSAAVSTTTQAGSTPAPAVASVTASPASHSFTQLGAQQQASATARDASGNLVNGVTFGWASSNPAVVSVSAAGMMTAVAAGSAQVVVSSGTCCGADTIPVTVSVASSSTAPAQVTDLTVTGATSSSVTLRWTQVSNGIGGPANYAVRYGTPAVTWTDSVPNANVVGTAVGSTVTHTFTDLPSGRNFQFQMLAYRGTSYADLATSPFSNLVTASTTVQAGTPSVTLEPGYHNFSALGQTAQFTATARDATGAVVSGETFTWSSTNSSVASVSNMGLVTARAAGSALIIVNSVCCGADTAQVTVDTQTSTPGTALYSDNFDSYASGSSLSGRGGNGFTWGIPNYAAVSSDRARSGSRSLKFSFGPTEPNGASHWWSEQAFNHPRLTEYWVEFYIWFPANYAHSTVSPTNNKFYTYWGSDYSSPPAGNASTWACSEAGAGGSCVGFINVGGAWSGANLKPLVGAGDRERWMRIRIHIKIPDVGQSNGLMQMWKDGALLNERRNEPFRATSATNYLSSGYLLGYDNGRFTQNTFIYIDDFAMYTSNPGW